MPDQDYMLGGKNVPLETIKKPFHYSSTMRTGFVMDDYDLTSEHTSSIVLNNSLLVLQVPK